MRINLSLSLLVITGTFLSAKATLANNSLSIVHNLVANNTLRTQPLDVNRNASPTPMKAELSAIDLQTSKNTDNLSSFSSDKIASAGQTNVFLSDVSTFSPGHKISAIPSQSPSEISIEILVPPPRTQVIPGQSIQPLAGVGRTQSISPVYPATNTATPSDQSTSSPTNSASNLSTELIYPLMNPAPVTSRFGWRTHPLTGSRRFHSGIDIAAPSGAPVVATAAGTVISSGWKGGYGKAVIIQHNNTQQTLYGHLSEVSVQAGQVITQGTTIGLVGSTGNSTGPHLHFESRMPSANGWAAVDPGQAIQYAVDNLRRSQPFAQKDLPPGL
jgi:murein DD-endopeptidase MepM/ murein hydrolase activator NlpD